MFTPPNVPNPGDNQVRNGTQARQTSRPFASIPFCRSHVLTWLEEPRINHNPLLPRSSRPWLVCASFFPRSPVWGWGGVFPTKNEQDALFDGVGKASFQETKTQETAIRFWKRSLRLKRMVGRNQPRHASPFHGSLARSPNDVAIWLGTPKQWLPERADKEPSLSMRYSQTLLKCCCLWLELPGPLEPPLPRLLRWIGTTLLPETQQLNKKKQTKKTRGTSKNSRTVPLEKKANNN